MATTGGKSRMILLVVLCVAAVMAVSDAQQQQSSDPKKPTCEDRILSCLKKLILINSVKLQNLEQLFEADPCCKDFASPATDDCACEFRNKLSFHFSSTDFCVADDPACPNN